eukprot:4288555-Ditylum_brightwellii.AAC.1
MMQSAEFQACMNTLFKLPAFMQAMQKINELIKDPERVKKMHADLEKTIKDGMDQLGAAKKVARKMAKDMDKDRKAGEDEMPTIEGETFQTFMD